MLILIYYIIIIFKKKFKTSKMFNDGLMIENV